MTDKNSYGFRNQFKLISLDDNYNNICLSCNKQVIRILLSISCRRINFPRFNDAICVTRKLIKPIVINCRRMTDEISQIFFQSNAIQLNTYRKINEYYR